MQFRLHLLIRRIIGRRDQLLFPAVLHLSHFLAHQLPEHKVHKFCYFRTAAKVFAQHNFCRIIFSVKWAVTVQFFHKNFRHRLSKTINALFHVADHKEIFALPGNCRKNHILCAVGILILIHQHFLVFLRRLLRQRSRTIGIAQSLHQKAQRHMLQVGKIQKLLLFFQLGILSVISENQRKKRGYFWPQIGNILPKLPSVSAKLPLGQTFDNLFNLIAPGLQ